MGVTDALMVFRQRSNQLFQLLQVRQSCKRISLRNLVKFNRSLQSKRYLPCHNFDDPSMIVVKTIDLP